MKYVVCLHLYMPRKFGERGSTPHGATGPSLSFLSVFLFFCLSVTLLLGQLYTATSRVNMGVAEKIIRNEVSM